MVELYRETPNYLLCRHQALSPLSAPPDGAHTGIRGRKLNYFKELGEAKSSGYLPSTLVSKDEGQLPKLEKVESGNDRDRAGRLSKEERDQHSWLG